MVVGGGVWVCIGWWWLFRCFSKQIKLYRAFRTYNLQTAEVGVEQDGRWVENDNLVCCSFMPEHQYFSYVMAMI